jgi:hypothetical protein
MITNEQNQYLTQTGSGTAMGDLFRSYWLPALMAHELPENDCPPVRVEMLSEKLIAFRDSTGQLGLIEEFCAHRGVSLWFGRVEENGIRCPYHGWKYNAKGQCVEVPSEDEQSGYAEKIKLKSYPLIEKSGLLWTYMGPESSTPAFPEFEFTNLDSKKYYFSKRLQETNYLQAMEGGIDSSHVAWLHRGSMKNDPIFSVATESIKYGLQDFKVHFDVQPSSGGLTIGARRKVEDDQFYWRITQWIMPTFVLIPPRGELPLSGQFWVPINDEKCWTWSFHFHPVRDLLEHELQAMKDGFNIHAKVIPGTFVAAQNKDNDYLMDREKQKSGDTYSGVDGIAMQDASLQESMGVIQDRSKENLVNCDNGIIMARMQLIRAAKELEKGHPPKGRDPLSHQVRAAALILKNNLTYLEAAKEVLISAPHKPITSI